MSNLWKKILTYVLLTIILLLIVPGQVFGASRYMISNSSLLLDKDDTYKMLIYEISKDNILNSTSKKVKWSSSNKKAANVNSKGTVTAKSVGKTVITGKIGDSKYTCNVTVKKLKRIDLNKGSNLTFQGKISTVVSQHIGNEESITCYILKLSTPVKFILGDYIATVAEIQLVPGDGSQEKKFIKADGTNIKVKGDVITGDTAWYIRDFGMINITIQ